MFSELFFSFWIFAHSFRIEIVFLIYIIFNLDFYRVFGFTCMIENRDIYAWWLPFTHKLSTRRTFNEVAMYRNLLVLQFFFSDTQIFNV